LTLLIVGVVQFRDVPEAAKELERHVEEAREGLKKRGLKFGYEI